MKYRSYFRTLRVMDANRDRLSEGLRVLEDVSRFIIGHASTTETLKRIRHELTAVDAALENDLLAARNAVEDVGRESPVEEMHRPHLTDLVAANAKRSQEALRVLEEFAKLPEIPAEMASRNFQQARFTLYEIEQELISRLSHRDKLERIDGLYLILDVDSLDDRNPIDFAVAAIAGGATVMQLRSKNRDKRGLLDLAGALRQVCRDADILFIINDNLDIALAVDADGAHLGRNDLPLPQAREILPPDKLIGYTVRTTKQALQAQAEGADYLGVGSVYASPTKPDAPVIGLAALRQIADAVSVPIVAIGGIDASNVSQVLAHGADGIAVVSAILNSEDSEQASRQMAKLCRKRSMN